jgi:hypothetical protein
VSPETCWAIKKHWNNKFYQTVASGLFFLWDLAELILHYIAFSNFTDLYVRAYLFKIYWIVLSVVQVTWHGM